MTVSTAAHRKLSLFLGAIALAALTAFQPAPATAQVTPFIQAVAERASGDRELADFYRARMYEPLWTGEGDEFAARRAALLSALERAGDHALPVGAYDLPALRAALSGISSQRRLGEVEVRLSRVFLDYAHHLTSGVLVPNRIDVNMRREVPRRDGREVLAGLASADNPASYMRSLAPQTTEYARLMKLRMELERQMADGGWGPTVPAGSLQPGQSGQAVVALRNRLIAMGFLDRSATMTYDAAIQSAVQFFQIANGLEPDGTAGAATMREINKDIEDRLPSVIVAMERERWLNVDRGDRHVLVNLTDFSAVIVDDGRERFRTKSVIGARDVDRQTYEFSDMMEYMEINPYWNLPRSIAMDYIPSIMANPGAAPHLELIDGAGRVVPRSYAASVPVSSPARFPFDLRQPPGPGNALGFVKFMFPNAHAIYLHDTPAKNLFSHDVRMYSHGCIRLNDPFEFGYVLLERQEEDPEGFFNRILDSRQNTQVYLKEPIPVHIIYRTAFTTAKGQLNFRPDHYGRDAKVWRALLDAGVSASRLQS